MTIALHPALGAAADRRRAPGDAAAEQRRGRRRGQRAAARRALWEIEIERILLKAAAGAGKSYVLKRLVADAVDHVDCARVAVIAFQNRQLWPLAQRPWESDSGATM